MTSTDKTKSNHLIWKSANLAFLNVLKHINDINIRIFKNKIKNRR